VVGLARGILVPKNNTEHGEAFMLSSDFIHLEMLADMYIDSVGEAKEQLENGQAKECLTTLADLHEQMQITLALGERYDAKVIN